MASIKPRRRRALLAVAAALLAAAVPLALRALLWRWEQNPVLRGRLLAEELGCFNCHRPYAGAEIPNPGSRWGTVPRFEAGNAFMYAPERRRIEEFIRYGAPRAWLDGGEVQERLDRQHLRMPVYGERLSDGEVADLVAYVAAVEGVERAGGEAAAAGRQIARDHGCLACHGVEGSGGLANPGSLGGFIPGFLGRNFEDLVDGEEEFREWVLEGTSSRLGESALVRFFWRRQKIAMPAYREELDEEQVADLWRWIEALRSDLSAR